MIKKFFFLSFALCSLFLALPHNPAYAVGKDSNTETKEVPKGLQGLLPRTFYVTQFFQDPSLPENEFYIKIASYGAVSGCAELTFSKQEIKDGVETITVQIKDPEVMVKKFNNPRYTNYDCKINTLSASVDVKLNRDTLMNHNVTKINIESEKYGKFNSADIKVTEQKIEMTTKSPEGDQMDTLWFFPKNTVLLLAPNAKKSDGLATQQLIKEFGIAQGFKPMEDVLDGYELPYNAENFALFVDETGSVRDQLKTPDDFVPIGHIKPTRKVHGPQGTYDESYDVEVFASLPGQDASKNLPAKKKPLFAKPVPPPAPKK